MVSLPTFELSEEARAGAEILQHLRAQTETETELESLRESAREVGESAYFNGPGLKRSRDWETLPETDPVFRREKKTRSAYVSRFKAQAYKTLLEEKVNDIARLNSTKRADLEHSMVENKMLKEQLRIMREQIARKEAGLLQEVEEVRQVVEQEVELQGQIPIKIPLSPVSPSSTILSTPIEEVPYPEVMSFEPHDPFALLPPSYTKIYAIDDWSPALFVH